MANKKQASRIAKNFYICGISFDTVEEYVAIRKIHEGFTMQAHLDQLSMINHPSRTQDEEVVRLWKKVKPMTLKKAKKLYYNDPIKVHLIKLLLDKSITWNNSDG